MHDNSNSIQHNRSAWQKLVEHRHRLTRAAREEDFGNPLASIDGPGWLGGDIQGKRVLCLASGGGRQGPLYAAAGAVVTVVDFCEALLDQDREVANARGLYLKTLQTCMTDLSALGNESFDVVIHPVSTCYVPNIQQVFREVARVMRHDGIYISQHKQPASLQAAIEPAVGAKGWTLEHQYYRREPLPMVLKDNLVREPGAEEYIHSWESIVGGMCRAGFVIEDLIEPLHADNSAASPDSFAFRSGFVPPYVRIKARRKPTGESIDADNKTIWQPDL